MMANTESLLECLTFLQKEVSKVRKELRTMPRGSLMIQMKRGHPEYLKVIYGNDGLRKRFLINKDMVLVYKLAHKAYLEEKLKRLETDLALCERNQAGWLAFDDASIAASLPKHFELLEYSAVVDAAYVKGERFRPCPVNDGSVAPVDAKQNIGTMDIDDWAVMPYCTNTKFEERKIHRTSSGLLCRSKGEVALIELCNRLGYRYHYDEAIWVCGKLRSPDLIIARRDGRLVYVEHRGWKGEEYDRSNLEKDILYFNAGIRQGRNYLITFESDDGGIDVELVEMQLRRMIEG